jgi:hypothetical protein
MSGAEALTCLETSATIIVLGEVGRTHQLGGGDWPTDQSDMIDWRFFPT